MALPSQIGQSGSGSRVSTSGRRERSGRTVMIVSAAAILVAAGALSWIMLRGRDGKLPTAAQPVTEPPATTGLNPGTPEPAKPDLAKAPPAQEPPISLLSQGTSKPPSTSAVGTPAGGGGREPVAGAAGSDNGKPDAGKPDGTRPPPTDLTRTGNPLAPADTTPSAAPPAGPASPLPAAASSAGVRAMIDEGDRKLSAGDPIAARTLFSRALADSRTTTADRSALREKLGRINDDLIFSNRYVKGEPFTEEYVVQSGDNPTKIFRKRDLATEPRLIEKTNKLDATKLRVGQKVKLIRGPFHAVVHKADFRLDLYAGSPDDQANWTFIKSFTVGLGESNSTPVGSFVVKSSSKLINPPWTNPKTGEKFLADDPKNPIGERWIGIEGVGDARQYTGFGIHGTVDPDSIGKMKSMGCIRMNSADVETVYDLLTEKVSVVRIEP